MSELLVIGIVALIVIGPSDLPEMFRQLGRLTAKMRAMAREFSRAMEQAATEAGVKDMARDLRAATDPKSLGLNAVKDAVNKFEKWDPIKNAAKPTPLKAAPLVPPPMPATPVLAAAPGLPAAGTIGGTIGGTIAGPAEAAVGPNTAALYDKKAARAAILRESAAKLKALDAAVPVADGAAKKPPRRKAALPVPEAVMAQPAAKPDRKQPDRKQPARKQKVAQE